MDNDETDFDPALWIQAVTRQSLLYYWFLRSLGHSVEDKIQQLEAEVYGKDYNRKLLGQKDVDELQLLLAIVDGVSTNENTKAIIFRRGYTKLIIRPDKNHRRPHFHLEYKSQHQASYAIDNLERLAGKMPKRYERSLLQWASGKQELLRNAWNNLQAGKDIMELISEAGES